jgi:ADP-ribosylarginine hydrolase
MNFYRKISFGSWPGATGIDSVLIAYDAILGAETFKTDSDKWEEFCLRGVLHGGDNDSTGAIGGAWFGALHGFSGVPLKNYKEVEDNVKLKNLGDKLYEIAGN